jgi:DNA-directed RNA polymerase subunit omega
MIEELKSQNLINKVGGRFRLTALVQKRLGELLQGGRPLVKETEGKTLLEIVVQEILQDKIAPDDSSSHWDDEPAQPTDK